MYVTNYQFIFPDILKMTSIYPSIYTGTLIPYSKLEQGEYTQDDYSNVYQSCTNWIQILIY